MIETKQSNHEEQIAIDGVLERLEWMQRNHIWPNGTRYLWTDAFGVVLLVSLYNRTGEHDFLDTARWVVNEVEHVLGQKRGIRIGQDPERDGQYYHYLTKWLFALERLSHIEPGYRTRAIELVKDIHSAFVLPGRGVWWKMQDDLGAPYPGFGIGALDAFDGYVVYRLLDEQALSSEIEDMRQIMARTYQDMHIVQDLALGMMLWMAHLCPDEDWARLQRERCLEALRRMWIDPPGYFCRSPEMPWVKYAFTNYGVSLGLQSVSVMERCVPRLEQFFRNHRSGDPYQLNAITHIMACTSLFPGEFIFDHAQGTTPTRQLQPS